MEEILYKVQSGYATLKFAYCRTVFLSEDSYNYGMNSFNFVVLTCRIHHVLCLITH